MATRRRVENDIPGFGVEDQWAREALRRIVELGRKGTLKDEPFYSGCPSLSTTEAELFGKLMDQERIRIGMLPFSAPPSITYSIIAKRGQVNVRIDMRPDVAAVIRGVVGFDDIVYQSQNKGFIQIVKDISREASKFLPKDPKLPS